MDAQTLLKQGIAALRDEQDVVRGRELLLQALRLDPQLDQGWLWLSRTVSDPVKKRQCVERALSINPDNSAARAYLAKLNTPVPLKAQDESRIAQALAQAETCLGADDIVGAVQHWAQVLEIVPDHALALPSAIRHLTRLKAMDDARQLVWNALAHGAQNPSIYLTAIDIARYQKDDDEVARLQDELIRLPSASEKLAADTIDSVIHAEQPERALELLDVALDLHPRSQMLLLRRAELRQAQGSTREALADYEQIAQLGASTAAGKAADQRLLAYGPRLTDRERGSLWLAAREALGVGVFFLVLAWQDAGLNLAQMGAARWGGVGMALVGGYLLVTATSSPQQQPLARWLGGQVPSPPEPDDTANAFDEDPTELPEATRLPMLGGPARAALGVVGGLLLLGAFVLVFSLSLSLLGQPNPEPFRILTWQDVINAGGE